MLKIQDIFKNFKIFQKFRFGDDLKILKIQEMLKIVRFQKFKKRREIFKSSRKIMKLQFWNNLDTLKMSKFEDLNNSKIFKNTIMFSIIPEIYKNSRNSKKFF